MKAAHGHFVSAIFFILASASAVLGQDAAKRAPVPAVTAQAEATKVFKDVYGDEYANAKTAAEKQALAQKLLAKANGWKDDPAGQFVVLRLARDIAAQASDGQTAFEAIDAMGAAFQVDVLENEIGGAKQIPDRRPQTLTQHKSIAGEALKLVDQAVSEDNFTVADQLGKLALAEARKAREKELVAQAQGRIVEIAELAQGYEDVKAAKVTLEKAPDDPGANLVVGKYLCLVKGDWDKGMPMLALGNDVAWKALARQELDGAASAAAQAKLGDDWWNLAEQQDARTKRQTQARAVYWYRLALPDLQGLAKAKVEKRLNEVALTEERKTVANTSVARTKLLIKTPAVGGNGGSPFEDRSATPLIGFRVTAGSVIKSLQPVYLNSSGTPSSTFGHPDGALMQLLAKPGYAVGAIYAKGGSRVDGFKVGFMRIKGDSLDPKDRYESPWVGGTGGNAGVQLGGEADAFQIGRPVGVKGKMVVGVWGRSGTELDCLGLIESYAVQAGTKIATLEPIVGKWAWKDRGEVAEFQADGSCLVRNDSTTVGAWACVDKKTGKYQIVWPKWGLNQILMSADGTTLGVTAAKDGSTWTARRLP